MIWFYRWIGTDPLVPAGCLGNLQHHQCVCPYDAVPVGKSGDR